MIHFLVHEPLPSDEDQRLWAECIEFPDVATQGINNTFLSLQVMCREAIDLYFDEPDLKHRIGESIKYVFEKGYREGFNNGWDACEKRKEENYGRSITN